MKKVFAIALIATTMVACNNSSDKKAEGDTTVVAPDTTTVVAPDTTATPAIDTTATAAPDSITK